MKRDLFIFSILMIMSVSLKSQTPGSDFGAISVRSIDIFNNQHDGDNEAVVLFDIAKSYFRQGETSFDLIFERTTRIRINTEAGARWAEIQIPLYQEGSIYEKVLNLYAFSYNVVDGKIISNRIEAEDIFEEKINNSWIMKKFVIPNVKPGSIIEYRYTIESQYIFNLRDWEFQWRIPVEYSEYEVKTIPFYEYNYILQGANKFDTFESYVDKSKRKFYGVGFSDLVYKFVMRDLPAFNSEEYISSINDYIIKLDFQLAVVKYPDGRVEMVMTSWEELKKAMIKDKDFGKYISKSEKLIDEILNKDEIQTLSQTDRFNIILNFIKHNMRWNRIYSKYASISPDELFKDKVGTSAELNLLTVGLLNACGIEAYPVLISTRGHGKVRTAYPYHHFFNSVVIFAKVDGSEIVTDATEINSRNDRIPERCINDAGLIIAEGEPAWVDLSGGMQSGISTTINLDLSDMNTSSATIVKSATEYDALQYRNTFAADKDALIKDFDSQEYRILPASVRILNHSQRDKPYILEYTHTFSPTGISNKYYVSPFIDEVISDNPLKQNTRIYPVDLIYPFFREFNTTINIPEGYTVEYLPEDLAINNDLFSLNYKTTADEQVVTISFTYSFKKSAYKPEDYTRIKYYFNTVIEKGNDKLVLTGSPGDKQ